MERVEHNLQAQSKQSEHECAIVRDKCRIIRVRPLKAPVSLRSAKERKRESERARETGQHNWIVLRAITDFIYSIVCSIKLV